MTSYVQNEQVVVLKITAIKDKLANERPRNSDVTSPEDVDLLKKSRDGGLMSETADVSNSVYVPLRTLPPALHFNVNDFIDFPNGRCNG